MDNVVSFCMDAFGLLIDIPLYSLVLGSCLVLAFTIFLIQSIFKVI